MIEVKLELYTGDEQKMFNAFAEALFAWREQKTAERVARIQAASYCEPAPGGEGRPPTEVITDIQGASVEVEIHPDEIRARQTEATIVAAAAVKTETGSQADIEAALREYAAKHDLPAARRLLDKHGIKQLGKAAPEQLAALAVELDA